ncbi:MAG: 50S ribosomal protein L24 [Patescibacteria group bacterium]
MHIKTGDNVRVMAGKDKGKEGKVIQAFPREGKIVVEKVNILKKHLKGRQGQPGQRIELAAPFAASRAQLICGACGKITRPGYTVTGDSKQRICRKCKKTL